MAERAVSRELAEYVAGLRYEDLPEETVRVAKEAVLDQFGIMARGSVLPWTRPVYDLAVDLGSTPQSRIVGSGMRVSAVDAAMVNSSYGHSCEMDDSGYNGGTHAGSIAVPAALSLADWRHSSGRDFLLAVVTGYEVLYRIGRVISKSLLEIGFHHQSVVGPFGSAAVAIQLLGLPPDTALHALSIAGSHASGTMEYDRRGGEVKRFHAAMATRAGVVAALLAQRGLTGPDTILEGARGIVRLFGRIEDAAGVTDGLEDRSWFAVQGRTAKIFPTAGGVPTSIQALIRLIDEHGFGAGDVAAIDVWVDPLIVGHGAAILEPQDTIGAQFSMAFSLALRLVTGRNDLADYMDPARWHDPAILDVTRRFRVHPHEQGTGADETVLFREAARVRVTLRDGRVVETEEPYRRGSPANPISREELVAKFHDVAGPVLPVSRRDEVVTLVDKLDDVDDMSAVVDLLVAG